MFFSTSVFVIINLTGSGYFNHITQYVKKVCKRKNLRIYVCSKVETVNIYKFREEWYTNLKLHDKK